MIVYICSRYAGNVLKNIRLAREYANFAISQGATPIVPHLNFGFMNDKKEREKILSACCEVVKRCDAIWVFEVDGVSEGMAREIVTAAGEGIDVVHWENVNGKYKPIPTEVI